MTNSTSTKVAPTQLALAVRIGQALHAVPISAVEEVLPALPIEPVPQCPEFIRGVVFVRGHLIPVLDAAERLGVKNHQRPPEPHIVCVRLDGRLIGFEVDEALDLVDLTAGVRLEAAEIGVRHGFFDAMVELNGEVIRLLNPDKLLDEGEFQRLEAVPKTA